MRAIVEQPFGAYPSAVPGYYDYDWGFWQNYTRLNRGADDAVKVWWQENVAKTKNDWEFLMHKVGWERLLGLRADPRYGYNPDLWRSI